MSTIFAEIYNQNFESTIENSICHNHDSSSSSTIHGKYFSLVYRKISTSRKIFHSNLSNYLIYIIQMYEFTKKKNANFHQNFLIRIFQGQQSQKPA